MNLTFITVNATTLDAAEETKYSFYDDLQDAAGRVPAENMLIVAGVRYARPGPVDAATWNILDQLARGGLMVTTWLISR